MRDKHRLLASFFTVNCHACFRHNKIPLRCELDPPMIEECIGTTQEHYFDGNYADEFMLEMLQSETRN